MSNMRLFAIISMSSIFGMVAGCEADPGTIGPNRYLTDSSGSGGAGVDAGVGPGAGGMGDAAGAGGAGTGGAPCDCPAGLTCCGDACVNLANDILNCGACGAVCDGATPFCDEGRCAPPPCEPEFSCEQGAVCCGMTCCGDGEICCAIDNGPDSIGPQCVTPVNGTCPSGCLTCD